MPPQEQILSLKSWSLLKRKQKWKLIFMKVYRLSWNFHNIFYLGCNSPFCFGITIEKEDTTNACDILFCNVQQMKFFNNLTISSLYKYQHFLHDYYIYVLHSQNKPKGIANTQYYKPNYMYILCKSWVEFWVTWKFKRWGFLLQENSKL